MINIINSLFKIINIIFLFSYWWIIKIKKLFINLIFTFY